MDTLTFQNQSLRDKAKRFEEALKRSTDEQIVVSLTMKSELLIINNIFNDIKYLSIYNGGWLRSFQMALSSLSVSHFF